MNKTTVKRGIGAVILALIAAALLAFLLNDKAAQRQEVVEIALPGTGDSAETSSQSTRLPTLTTDNSGNGDVIANAGTGSGSDAANTGTAASDTNSDGTIIASAAATGAAAIGTAASTATNTAKNIDFSVKPTASKASGEFLDLVNNGDTPATKPKTTDNAAQASSTTQQAAATTNDTSNADQGVVIASTSPKSISAKAHVVQPRLIGEKRSAPIKSARTAKVITKKAPAKASSSTSSNTKPSANTSSSTNQAKNGYAIQLLATSSQTRANSLKNVMAGEGYPTYVTKTKQNGKTLYRVRIGQYAAKSAAIKAHAAMKRRYKKNTNVIRSAIVAR